MYVGEKSEIEIKSIFFMDFELGLEEIYGVMGVRILGREGLYWECS